MNKINTELDSGKKLEFRFVYVILGFIFAILMLIAYWTFAPVDVLEIKKLPVPVTDPQNIRSGRLVILEFDYCKYHNFTGSVERQLVSERLVLDLPSYKDHTPKSCGQISAPIILPYTVATQKFHIHYKVTYRVNPIKTVVEEFDTVEFEILPVPLELLQKGE